MTAAAPLGAFVAQHVTDLRLQTAPSNSGGSFEALLDPEPKPLPHQFRPDLSEGNEKSGTPQRSSSDLNSAPDETVLAGEAASQSVSRANVSLGMPPAVEESVTAQETAAPTPETNSPSTGKATAQTPAAEPVANFQNGSAPQQGSKQAVEGRTFRFPDLGVFGIELATADNSANGAHISMTQEQSASPERILDPRNVSISPTVAEPGERQPLPTSSSMQTAAPGEYRLPSSIAQPSFPYLPTQKTAPGEYELPLSIVQPSFPYLPAQKTAPGEYQLPLSVAQPSLPPPVEGVVEFEAQLPIAFYRPLMPTGTRGMPIEQDPQPAEEDVAELSSIGAGKLPPGNFEVRAKSSVALAVSDENGTLVVTARALGATAEDLLGMRKLMESAAQEFHFKLGEFRLNGIASQQSAKGGVLGSHSS